MRIRFYRIQVFYFKKTNNIIIHYYIMNNTLENQILINKGDSKNSNHESTLIDIESNCCNFNNNQRNTRRIITRL